MMKLAAKIVADNLFVTQHVATDWQDAVQAGCALLEEQGYITADYYQGILNSVAEHGPYFVILPGIAMPHARPEAGAIKTGCSLVILKEPVVFGHEDHDPVSILFTMAAKNNEELNEGILMEIMTLLDDDHLIEQLKHATDGEQVRDLLS
ncbi:PTS sugar transporter subunit IIA [Candidatus Pantoea floridensis]|nr:PTS sugar transporter subunit IIA [Pantoea floridensis]